jgi:hypothetical protein
LVLDVCCVMMDTGGRNALIFLQLQLVMGKKT